MVRKYLSRWCGTGAVAVLLGALLVVLLTSETLLPADQEAKTPALPSDLAKIPGDAVFLVSGRIADLWNSDLNKPVRQKLAKEMNEGARDFEKKFGLPVDQVERMTMVVLDESGRGEPLLFVRTIKP